MAKRKTQFSVGLFVAVGIGIAVVAIVWLGMNRFFEEGSYYAVYFNESVQGLNVDAPVKYRGVTIGRVEQISVAPDSRLIEVIMKIETDIKLEEDMVAQLRVVGITGSMFIELDRRREDDGGLAPRLSFPTEYPVVASRPSEISELFRGIDEIVQKLNALDVEGISRRLMSTLDHLDHQVQGADTAGISRRLKQTLDRIDRQVAGLDLEGISAGARQALASLNSDLEPERWHRLIDDLNRTVLEFRGVLDTTDRVLTGASGVVTEADAGVERLMQHLSVVSRELEEAGRNLNRVLEKLADQPSQLLFAEPPPPRLLRDGTEDRVQ